MKNKILNKVVNKIGEQFYIQIYTLVNNMNIDINQLLKDCKDYNQFWELVYKYYSDYVNNND